MYTFYLQLQELTSSGIVRPFFIFFIVVWALWVTKMIAAALHTNYKHKYRPAYSVIVPVYKEDPDLFKKVLSSIAAQKPTDLVVAVDGGAKDMIDIARNYATTILELKKVGKRQAVYEASKHINYDKSEVVIVVDSDTIWTESTLNILNPFVDAKVGGVTGKHEIFEANRTLTRKIASWMEELRFNLIVPAQDIVGSVLCLPGRTMAFRAEVFKHAVEQLIIQKIFGLDINTGDDRELTTQVIKQGYKAVYQSDSLVYTDAPDTPAKYAKQQLRWYRSVMRETFFRFSLYIRQSPIATIWSLEFIIGSLIFVGLVISTFLQFIYGFDKIYTDLGVDTTTDPLLHIVLGILALLLGFYIKQIIVLIRNPKEIVFLPVFAIYMLLILLPVKLVALFTFLEQGWNTRTQEKSRLTVNHHLARTFTAIFGFILCLLLIPLSFIAEMNQLNIPVEEAIAGKGVEYYYNQKAVINNGQVAGENTQQ